MRRLQLENESYLLLEDGVSFMLLERDWDTEPGSGSVSWTNEPGGGGGGWTPVDGGAQTWTKVTDN
jgi:hypothetical protein